MQDWIGGCIEPITCGGPSKSLFRFFDCNHVIPWINRNPTAIFGLGYAPSIRDREYMLEDPINHKTSLCRFLTLKRMLFFTDDDLEVETPWSEAKQRQRCCPIILAENQCHASRLQYQMVRSLGAMAAVVVAGADKGSAGIAETWRMAWCL